MPTAEEAKALSGLELYRQGVQPVWLKIENRSDSYARVITWSIDRDYFAPIEVAYTNKRSYSKQGYEDMQRWFYESSLPRLIPPGETRSGLVYTNLRPGTKGFNLTVMHQMTARDFTFFLPLPGFVPDFMTVDFDNLYTEEEKGDYDRPTLRRILEEDLGCCATNRAGDAIGGPINAVFVANGPTVRRAMLRGGWLETSSDGSVAVRARQQSFRGRQPDAIFSQSRDDGEERIVLHLWLAPWTLEGTQVWLGQV